MRANRQINGKAQWHFRFGTRHVVIRELNTTQPPPISVGLLILARNSARSHVLSQHSFSLVCPNAVSLNTLQDVAWVPDHAAEAAFLEMTFAPTKPVVTALNGLALFVRLAPPTCAVPAYPPPT
jgi:hypothetical protein